MSAKCPYCGKTPRSKLAKANAARYAPYCSFHCQEWANLHRAAAYVRTLSPESASQCDEHDHTKSDPVAAHGEPVAVEEALRWADNLADLDFLNDVKVLAAEVRRLRAADRKDAARLRFLLETDDTDDAGLWAEIASLSGIDADAARAAIDAAMSADVRSDFVSPVSSPDQTLPAPSAVAQWQPIHKQPCAKCGEPLVQLVTEPEWASYSVHVIFAGDKTYHTRCAPCAPDVRSQAKDTKRDGNDQRREHDEPQGETR